MAYRIDMRPQGASAYADFKAVVAAMRGALSGVRVYYWQGTNEWIILTGLEANNLVFCYSYGSEALPSADLSSNLFSVDQLSNEPGNDWDRSLIKVRPVSGTAYADFKIVTRAPNLPLTQTFYWQGSSDWEIVFYDLGLASFIRCTSYGSETFPSSFVTDYPSAISLTARLFEDVEAS